MESLGEAEIKWPALALWPASRRNKKPPPEPKRAFKSLGVTIIGANLAAQHAIGRRTDERAKAAQKLDIAH